MSLDNSNLIFFPSSKSAVSSCVSKCFIQVSNLVEPFPLNGGTAAIRVIACFCSFNDWSSEDALVFVNVAFLWGAVTLGRLFDLAGTLRGGGMDWNLGVCGAWLVREDCGGYRWAIWSLAHLRASVWLSPNRVRSLVNLRKLWAKVLLGWIVSAQTVACGRWRRHTARVNTWKWRIHCFRVWDCSVTKRHFAKGNEGLIGTDGVRWKDKLIDEQVDVPVVVVAV